MRLRLDLDGETAAALLQAAMADLRNPAQQAVATLRRGLGLAVPYPDSIPGEESREQELVASGAPHD
jgi:hypothetical protein